jgi:hypothetical protein
MKSRMHSFSALFVLVVSLQAAAAAQVRVPDTTGSALALQQSRDATRDMLLSLRRTLEDQLAAGGPIRAIAVCADTAQVMTEAIGKKSALAIRRVSDRWRNPLNEPDGFERSVLTLFAEALRETTLTDASEHSEAVLEDGRRIFRYLKPIRIVGMCTACHGEPSRMDPALREVIRDRYPDDRATGYAIGDLRGAVSIRVPLPDPRNR